MGRARLMLAGFVAMSCVVTSLALIAPSPANADAITPVQSPQGNWVGEYGSDGWVLAGWDNGQDVMALPTGVTFSADVANGPYTWATSTTDSRALESFDETSRKVAVWWHPDAIELSLHFTNAYSGVLSLYAIDWDSDDRREEIVIDDGSGPDSADLDAAFTNGAWVSTPVSVGTGGTITITATRTGSYNAVIAGLFLGDDGPPLTSETGAIPVEPVEGPQGKWVGRYGAGGRVIAAWAGGGDLSLLPPGVTFTVDSGTSYAWANSTSDVRALSSSDEMFRSVGVWYGNNVQLTLHFTDAYQGAISVYSLDWDSDDRRQTLTISDGSNDYVANLTSSFQDGVWVTVPVDVPASGSVTIQGVKTGAYNAVIEGVFLDNGTLPEINVARHTEPQGDWVGSYGSDGYDLAAWSGSSELTSLPSGVTATLDQGSRYTWAASTTDQRGLQSPDTTSRKVAVWYGDLVEVTLHFTNAYRGTVSIYSVDWDSDDRRQIITVEDGTNTIVGNLSASFQDGAWITAPVDVPANGEVTVTVNRTGAYNAVVSGIFLGNAHEVDLGSGIDDPVTCGLAGGNMFFSETTYVEMINQNVVGCWRYEGCISDLASFFGSLQEWACDHLDMLTSILDTAGKPFEALKIAIPGTDDFLSLGFVGTQLPPVITRAGAPALVTAGIGTVVVSGVAYGLSTVIEADETATAVLEQDTEVLDRIRDRVQVDTIDAEDRDIYKTTVALNCLQTKLIASAISTGLQALGLGTVDANGYIGTQHICELLPIYMPADYTRSGIAMPHTTQHIREVLGWSEAPDPTPTGEQYNAAWSLLRYATTPSSSAGWYGSYQVENTLGGVPYASMQCSGATGDGLTCDEYPYRSTYEGGPGASLKIVPTVPEVAAQGGDLSGFLNQCGIIGVDGTAYIVLPLPRQESTPSVPVDRSAWVCGP
jgi:hypothetical protein